MCVCLSLCVCVDCSFFMLTFAIWHILLCQRQESEKCVEEIFFENIRLKGKCQSVKNTSHNTRIYKH